MSRHMFTPTSEVAFGKGGILRLGFRKTGWHIAALTLEQMCRLFYLKRATEYLTGRPQFVRMGSVLSDVVVSDTGAPQGTVLSPSLFTLYTTDFQYNTGSCHLQKFSDDSAVVGRWRKRGGVQDTDGQLCGVDWIESPAAEHQQDQRDGDWF